MSKHEIRELRRLLDEYLKDTIPFNEETDCYEKWMESVMDEVQFLLRDYKEIHYGSL